jgi:hypothetical protein
MYHSQIEAAHKGFGLLPGCLLPLRASTNATHIR